ncbi:cell cycle progression protein 1 isoform X2 [Pseudoliparis swirei]|uniref:cell cycle progression protein 1 isoform X2 n=1 Tax=Pseudoliparis swirei TaxID=2059687 RepID=UPI0024BDA5C9|nr:cell cycle progression protein 1 isoform X2 [Pseudoliparis swirei]
MSETSSDAESSCGWTIISNEGSDIETLGSEAAVEAELLERAPGKEAELQHNAQPVEEHVAESLDETLEEQTIDETLCSSEAGDAAKGTQLAALLSSSDHSDIVTLGDLKEGEHVEAAANREFDLGTSCSSLYAFTATEAAGLMLSHWKLPQSLVNLGCRLSSRLTGGRSLPVYPVQQPPGTNSSSSEDEAGRSTGTVVRRRRLRKNIITIVTEPEEEALESGQSEEEEEEVKEQKFQQQEEEEEVKEQKFQQEEEEEVKEQKFQQEEEEEVKEQKFQQQEEEEEVKEQKFQQEEEEEVKEQKFQQEEEEEAEVKCLDSRLRGQGGSILNSCILMALVIAISMGFGHFHGTVQIQERQTTGNQIRVNEVDAARALIQHVGEQALTKERDEFGSDDPEEQKGISLLTEVIEKIKKENQELNIKQEHIQAQRDDLELLLKQRTEERTNIVSQQQELTAENQLLKTSRERDEESLSTLQLELRNLHSKMRDWEAMEAGTHALLSEIQRLKEQLEEEKRLIESFHSQRADTVAEAQTLNHQLDEERTITGELRRELHVLRNDIPTEAASEAEELQSRLAELEKRLSFEQHRSDLWKKLYVETKGDGAREDAESKSKRTNESMAGKVKQTFDAVKNSTKEFVHHHREQIKKANEAVKEKLRKFSDSVKSTFRHFKDSASTFFNKARGVNDKRRGGKNTKESRSHRFHKPPHRN